MCIRDRTREEAADFEEPDAFYEDEDGIKYQLTEWELEEKAGEETRVPMEKQMCIRDRCVL